MNPQDIAIVDIKVVDTKLRKWRKLDGTAVQPEGRAGLITRPKNRTEIDRDHRKS